MTVEIACRLTIAAIMLVGISIAVPFRRRADRVGGRVPRSADGPGFLTALVVIAVPMMLMPLCFVVHPPWMHWSQLDLPTWVRLGGAPLGAAALILLYHMFSHLGLNVTTTSVPRPDAFLVTTGPEDYFSVRQGLEAKGIKVEAGGLERIPENTIEVQGREAEKLLKLIGALEDQDDVNSVAANYEIDPEILAQLSG